MSLVRRGDVDLYIVDERTLMARLKQANALPIISKHSKKGYILFKSRTMVSHINFIFKDATTFEVQLRDASPAELNVTFTYNEPTKLTREEAKQLWTKMVFTTPMVLHSTPLNRELLDLMVELIHKG